MMKDWRHAKQFPTGDDSPCLHGTSDLSSSQPNRIPHGNSPPLTPSKPKFQNRNSLSTVFNLHNTHISYLTISDSIPFFSGAPIGILLDLLHYMLPRKRPAEGGVVEGGSACVDCNRVVKAHRTGCFISCANKEKTSGFSGAANTSGNNSVDEPSLAEMAFGNGNSRDIDEDLHSRQLAVYGRETMRRLFASNVLVSGLQGLGAEIAKSLILAGVKSVMLHDEGTVELWDLSSNFIFSESDVGKNRALASLQKLQELNNAVTVSTLTTKLTKGKLSEFQAVVFTDISLKDAVEFDDYCHCHQPPIAFIKAEVRGLFGSVFCDFGPQFTVSDVDGEEPHTGIVASISNDNPALVSCVDDERLEFQDGDLVVFSEIRGMTELNDAKPRKIISARPYSFTLDEDTTKFGVYERGGMVTQVKQPKVLNFKPLREALKDPGDFLLSDFSKFDHPPLLHLAFQALDKFRSEMGRFPIAGSEGDAQKIIFIANDMNESLGNAKIEDINPKLLRHFSFGARAVLNPMAAMFGGIVGQEVAKACSGKFHPLFQFFYFDSVESLPTEALEPSDFSPLNCRYDAQISVFGHKLQKKLEEAKMFLVGSGALGCEFLKNLALMGVACNSQGKLTVTDDDVIEKSNLSRQFLFRDWNIGQAKSTVAAAAATSINPHFLVEALQNRVGPETENVFDDTFWENLNVVINALDNVNARLYVDQRCVYFQKPLLESGTLGTKCNTQMVIPHLTENYGASRDPPEKQAPMCTLHSFPHNIDHCLTWARSEFEGLLEKTPSEVNAYLSSPGEYTSAQINAGDAQARDKLERVLECIDKERCETFRDAVAWARLKFEDYFSNRVKQLIFTFPEDAITSSGAPFWSAPKRFPHPLQFSSKDPSHLHFIMAASILRAETFGIPIPEWATHPKKLAEAVDSVVVPEFQPKKDAKIVTDEKATNLSIASIDNAAVINELIMKLEQCRKRLPPNFRMKPIQFEKDDNTNYHMDLIAGLANMRARNYSIPEVDKLKAKFIAGRIIPAIATSTALATGLVCLELYKVLDGGHKLEDYRNTFANLALPLFSMAEPVPPKVIKHRDMSWTVWDRWVIKDNPTLKELIQWLADKGLNAYSISCGNSLLFNSMFPRHKERMNKKIVDLARDIAKVELPPYRRHLDVVVACEDDEENDVDIPLVSVYFR
ncbi:PREDICTED: ubiquitin-activating enzyme E1 1-like isoform X1 [Ipomoea nil]|uniref:ubiquitin-activating enzyme E1 1-like isoform X1 n=3 Tax=Ipomoea nil TaxID=35883 RepID=UPI0009017CA7|nr:PREDICTED: ubiquitin-activating enzyme E1 1-like isoform X1 [Ipomoea nil]